MPSTASNMRSSGTWWPNSTTPSLPCCTSRSQRPCRSRTSTRIYIKARSGKSADWLREPLRSSKSSSSTSIDGRKDDPMKTIAVMVESHYDPTEPGAFSMYFPANGYSVEFISDLRGGSERTFQDNDGLNSITVTRDIRSVKLADYAGLVLVGGYGMVMLRYQGFGAEGKPNISPPPPFAPGGPAAPHPVTGRACPAPW